MLGETVRSTRIRRGLTQAKLARLAGVSRRHLAALEKGANVSISVLRKVAAVLELTEIDVGGVSLRTRPDTEGSVNVPLLADTLREARVDAHRAQTLLARAEALVGGEDAGVVVEFPRTAVRWIDLRENESDAIAEQEEMTRIKLSGELRNGEPIDESVAGEVILLPNSMIEGEELLFRVRGPALQALDIDDGDLLVVELRPRGRAASGELIIAKVGTLAYVGRWWQKHGRRAVVSNPMTDGTSDKHLKVMAAVNVVVRAKNR
jgi:transcriptional regulator with XRE-family HTH domain